jgi:hypothetical protein
VLFQVGAHHSHTILETIIFFFHLGEDEADPGERVAIEQIKTMTMLTTLSRSFPGTISP